MSDLSHAQADSPSPEAGANWATPRLKEPERRRRARHRHWRVTGRALLFVAPYMVLWAVFLALPTGWAIFLSFNSGGIVDDRRFVGLDNWTRMVGDSQLRTAIINTAMFVVVAIAVTFCLAIGLASLLNRYRTGSNFFKLALYFPLLAPPILAAMMWFFLVHFDFGILNLIQRRVFGGTGINFLGENPNALLTIVAVEVWRGLGFWVLYFLAGLQSVPEELTDAAKLDGARAARRFAKITVPTLRPLLLFAIVIAVIFNFQIFDSVQILTQGGPSLGTATVVWFIFRRMFAFQDTGIAFAASVGLLGVILVLTLISFRLLGRREEREA